MQTLKSLGFLLAFFLIFLILEYIDTLFHLDPLNPYILAANGLMALTFVFLGYVITTIFYKR